MLLFSRRMLYVVVALVGCSSFSVSAWSSQVSSFGGSALMTTTVTTTTTTTSSSRSTLEMKKGKPNVPVNMRGNYNKQKQMAGMRQQMIEASTPGADGLPVFNLFVRTKKANMWYPCGSFKGDEKSKALAQSFADGGMLSGISKKQLDGGIAGSLYSDLEKLKESVCRAYPQLRKSSNEFEWGYKLGFQGLPEDKSTIVMVEPKESSGPLSGLTNLFN